MKIFFDTIGCRLNQAEIEQMAGQFRSAGFEILATPDDADVVVINSCAVTAAAVSDSRQKVRQAHHKGAERIILTGCWATLQPNLANALEGVSEVVSNLEKANLPSHVLDSIESTILSKPIVRQFLPGIHKKTRAFIKIQDGCNNSCTYCVTRLARGKGNSTQREKIAQDISLAEKGGAKEVVLTGVHLGSWGTDFSPSQSIRELLEYLLGSTTIERIRLSSLEPWDLDEKFFELWQNPRLCPHFHLPLQSGSRKVLQRMARNTTPEKYRSLVDLAHTIIPDIAITTDLIVGFPGETEEEFNESHRFVREICFSGGHVFKFSSREGTAAAQMTGGVHGLVARERSSKMREVLKESERNYLKNHIGQSLPVLWESAEEVSPGSWCLGGLTSNYMRVFAQSNENKWNSIDTVRVERIENSHLLGFIQNHLKDS
jgi:threonylcarbamoyladenosine tRNA methylthiotransferase MtaB